MENNSEQPIQTPQARDMDFREVKIQKRSFNPLFGGLFLLVIIVILIAISYLFLGKNSGDTNKNSKKIETKKATVSAKPKSEKCADGEDFVNVKQGYEVCLPKDWVQKELKASGLKIGIDPKKVDEKFPGTITISISDQSESLVVQEISNNTSKFEFGPFYVNKVKGTQVTYTRLKSDSLSEFPKGIDTVVTKFERTYTVSLNSSEVDFESNKVIYETFLKDFKFIKNTTKPPWSKSRNILVNTPWIDDSIKSPVEISGEAIAFEGVVNIRIKDDDNHILAETTTQNESGVERSAFKISLGFGKATSKKGTVEVYTISAKDGEEQDKVTIPIVFP